MKRLARGRKFTSRREKFLLKNLATSLILNESITTTLPRAKELGPYIDRLIKKSKQGNLAQRRYVISKLTTETAARKLWEELAPNFKERSSGFTRLKRAGFRIGDNTQLAKVELILSDVKPLKLESAKARAAVVTAKGGK